MQRAAVLWRASPARLVAALFVVMLAAVMAVGSGASFTAQSANPGNIFTAGALTHSNNKDTQAIFTSTALMKPGDSRTGTVEIQNTGNIPGVFTVAGTITASTPGSGGGNLGAILDVLVEETNAAGTTVIGTPYTGKLNAFTAQPLGTYAAGQKRYYRFTVTWPNGTPAVDNPAQNASVTARFNWESTSN